MHSVQFSGSIMSNSLRPHALQHTSHPCPPNPRACFKLISIESVIKSNHLTLCHPVPFFSCLQSVPASGSFPVSQFFTSGGQSTGASASAIVWKFSNEYSELISFQIDWFDIFAVHVTLKSLLQHHSSKTSVLWRLAFFIVQLSLTL